MPNHVENDLYIQGPGDQIAAFLDFIGFNETPPAFDFNRIMPYPEPWATMDREANEFGHEHWPALDDPERETKLAALKALEDAYEARWGTRSDGYNSGGYQWCRDAWGTRWGAYDVARRDYGGCVLTFQTAWSPPADAVFAALHKRFPLLTLTHEYFERGMGFCGGATWYAEDDWYEDAPWQPGIKVDAWETRQYRGKRGG